MHTTVQSDVAAPVKDAHAASVVPNEVAAHETTAARASSSHGRCSPPPWPGLSSVQRTNSHGACKSYRRYAEVEARIKTGIESPWGGKTLCLSHCGYTSWRCCILAT